MGKPLPNEGKCKELYSLFLFLMPGYKEQVEYYGPLDRQSIRIRLYSGRYYIFEYEAMDNWSFETEKHRFADDSRSKHASL